MVRNIEAIRVYGREAATTNDWYEAKHEIGTDKGDGIGDKA